jgi:CRISPR/Cas system-associated exonuclease Cas4 (RecB family)
MAALPQPQASTAQAILRWWEAKPDAHRAHLGASLIGHPCDRRLWLTFRWAGKETFSGRILRLFSTGQREEARVVEELRGIGCEVHADDGQAQFRVAECDGHFGGSMDGVVLGLPEAPTTWHVLEVKTHSAKSFKELAAKGVQSAKPLHYAQMQTYMHLGELERALYYAVNKDTDDTYLERVPYDRAYAERLVAKAQRIISADAPPPRLSNDPAWFECKFCPFHEQCHGQRTPEANCRTCVHSSPVANAQWECASKVRTLTLAQQRQGCEAHLFIPPMLDSIGEPVDGTADSVTYKLGNGGTLTNGVGGISSHQLHGLGLEAATAPALAAIAAAFPGAKVTAVHP